VLGVVRSVREVFLRSAPSGVSEKTPPLPFPDGISTFNQVKQEKSLMPSKYTALVLALLLCAGGRMFAQAGRADASLLQHAHSKVFHPAPHDITNGKAHSRWGIHGIDSIPNFNGQFFANGYDFLGNPNRRWFTNTVGNPPQMGRTTTIHAPVVPVSVELDDASGNVLVINGIPMIADATQFMAPVLGSPVFANYKYSSGTQPTQISDAIQRAEFYNQMKPNWHTLLGAAPQAGLTMKLQQSADCPTGENFAGCNYVFAPNPDGTCCAYIVVNDGAPDFVFDTGFGNEVNAAISSGAINTKSISTFVFPNVFLFDGDITQCCGLGYHTYFFAPGTDPELRWVVNYSSWISPGLFGDAFVDVTAVSHEIAETYNDPFVASDAVHNVTPFWLAPNGLCGDVLETGDVIEGLPNATMPITLNGFTYHPQNEALIQWFKTGQASDALDGAYSYPDTSVLTEPAAFQNFGCAQ
jgi:hypothetical protein